MKSMSALCLVIVGAFLLNGCGNAGPNAGSTATSKSAFEIKIDGKDVPMEVKSSWQQTNDYSEFTPAGVPKTTTGLQDFVLRNFAFDKPPHAAIVNSNEKLTAPGQIFIAFTLWDEKGTTDRKTLVKVATYASDHKDSMSLSSLSVHFFAEGKDQIEGVSFSSSFPNNKGEVKITSVAGDTVSGEIDISGESLNGKTVSVKGKFTAKIYRP